MGNVKTTCLRFNLDKPLHSKAWEILQAEEKSHSKLISEALIEYKERHSRLADDPYFESREREDRFVEQIVTAVENAVKAELPPPEQSVTEADTDDIDYDFLSGA